MRTQKQSALTRLPERVALVMACAPILLRTKEKGRTPHERAAFIKSNLHGQNITPRNTSNKKISLGKADLHGTRVTARPQTTGRAPQFSRSETTFLRGIQSSFFTGAREVVDPHERSGISVHRRPTSKAGAFLALFLRSFLHHSKKWVSSFSLSWGARGLGES